MTELTNGDRTVVVDVPRMIIYDKACPEWGIHIHTLGGDKVFHFNRQQGLFIAGPGDGDTRNELFRLPELVKVAPEAIAKMYGYSSIRQLPERDSKLNIINEVYRQRVAGKLPELSIDGVEFVVDGFKGEIIAIEGPFESIKLKKLPSLDDGRSIMIWDQSRKTFADVNLLWKEHLPDNHKVVLIPPVIVLDPVGLARAGQLNDYCYVSIAPVQLRHDAAVFEAAQFGYKQMERKAARIENEKPQKLKRKTKKSL